MGMSASQARYLSLTARRNNNEHQAQQVSQQKTMLAMQMDMVATDYTEKKSNRQMLFVTMDPSGNQSLTQKLTYETIIDDNPFSGLGMRITDVDGNIVVPNPPNFAQMEAEAEAEYQAAITNNCFETDITNPSDGSTSKLTYTGKNFMSSYMSGFGNNNLNPILRNGEIVDLDELNEDLQGLNPAQFYEYWVDNQLSFRDEDMFTVANNTRTYTEDDDNAKAKLDKRMAEIAQQKKDTYTSDLNCLNPDYLEEKLRNGEWLLEKRNTEANDLGDWISTPWACVADIEDALDKTDDATAEAEYAQQSEFFHRKDKILEQMLKRLDTEHSAIETEMESVKKVVDKNVESSFKTFG